MDELENVSGLRLRWKRKREATCVEDPDHEWRDQESALVEESSCLADFPGPVSGFMEDMPGDKSSGYSPSIASPLDEPRVDHGGRSSALDDSAHISHLYANRLRNSGIVMPWETPLMQQIFGELEPMPQLGMPIDWGDTRLFPSVESIDGPAGVSEPMVCQWQCGKLVEHRVDESYLEQRDRTLRSAIKKWQFLVMLDPKASEVGRQLLEGEESTTIIKSVIGVKSPNTAVKRANALMMFYRWHSVNRTDPFLPFREPDVWCYVFSQAQQQDAASRSQSLVQALRFAHFVMGFDGALDCANSRRVAGQSQLQLAGKRPTRQARALLVEEVMKIHKVAADPSISAVDRTIASNLLMAMYGRCRMSDLNHIHEILHDMSGSAGFVELTTRFHKTSKTAQQKSMLLPIVVSCAGVDDDPWVHRWIANRKETGLPTSGIVDGPLMPAPTGNASRWGKRPLTPNEVTKILRVFVSSDDPTVSSHSLKATTLAWSAKAELPREHRRVLGRHSSAVVDADSLYSRDLSVGPVRALERVILLIKSKQFFPDAQRSNYFPGGNPLIPGTPRPMQMQPMTPAFQVCRPALQTPTGPRPAEHDHRLEADRAVPEMVIPKDEPDGWTNLAETPMSEGVVIELSSDTGNESASTSELNESSEDDREFAETYAVDRAKETKIAEGFTVVVQNTKTKVVHECKSRVLVELASDRDFHDYMDGGVTTCGRIIDKRLELIQSSYSWTLRCRVCFRGRRQE